MTGCQLDDINKERLSRWRIRLLNSHATATVLVGIGHDRNSGQWVLCALEDGPTSENAALAAILRKAADMLEKGETIS